MHPRYSEGPTCFTFGAHRVGQMMTGQRDNETLGSTCTTLSRCEAANLSAHQLRRCREHGGGVGGDAGGKGGGGRLHLLSLRPSEGHLPVRVQHVSAGCDSCEDERACQSRRLGADKGVSAWPKGLPRRQRAPQCAAPHGRHFITIRCRPTMSQIIPIIPGESISSETAGPSKLAGTAPSQSRTGRC